MANLITTDYFKRNLNIGDISEGNSPIVGNTTATDYIPYYTKECLIKVMGYSFYKAFQDALDAATVDDEIVDASLAEKWQDLKNGTEYTVGSKTYKWIGFTNDDNISLIANYIYCKYWEANYIAPTTIGIAANNIQNAQRISPSMQIWQAWLDMRKMVDDLYYFLNNNKATYTEWDSSMTECLGSQNAFDL